MDTSDIPVFYLHDTYFDAWTDVGTTVGKLLRYSFKFDPKRGKYTKKYDDDDEQWDDEEREWECIDDDCDYD